MTKFSPLNDLALQERTRREILQRSETIPPLPEVVVRVLALLNDNGSEPAEIEEYLQYDHVLVGRVLAMANSSFLGLRRPVKTIREAILVLGYGTLRVLVLASSASRMLKDDYSCYGHDERGLWRHALVVGVGARTLGRLLELPESDREELFMAGLLHDIGKTVVAPYLQARKVTVHQATTSIVEAELQAIGIDHGEAGALIAAKWNLSPTVQDLLKHHHGGTDDEALKLSLGILRTADALAHEHGAGYLPGRAPVVATLEQDRYDLALDDKAWAKARATLDEVVAAALAGLQRVIA